MARRLVTKTRYPGVYRLRERHEDGKTHMICGAVKDQRREGVTIPFERLIQARSDEHASALRVELIAELQEGRAPATAAARMTLSASAKSWLALHAPTVDPGTAETYAAALVRICGDPGDPNSLGLLWSDELRADDVQAWVNRATAEGYAAATVAGWFRVLRTLVRARRREFSAELREDLDGRAVKLPAESPAEEYAPTNDQVREFLRHMELHHAEFYAFARWKVGTGLRGAHLAALRWDDIDREARVVRPARKVYRGRVGVITSKKPAPRRLPITVEMLRVIDEHRARLLREQHPGLAEGWVFPARRAGRGKDRIGPMPAGAVAEAWASSSRAAGIDPARWTPHGARGTWYDLARGEVDALVARSITAHSDERMRADYSTVGIEEQRVAMEVVEQRIGLAPLDQPLDRSRKG